MNDTTKLKEGRKVNVRKYVPMNPEHMKHWSPHLRNRIRPMVWKTVMGVGIMRYDEVKDRTTLAKWLHKGFGFGDFYVYSWRKGYFLDKARKRFVLIARVQINESKVIPYEANFIDLRGIKRYKFFTDEE